MLLSLKIESSYDFDPQQGKFSVGKSLQEILYPQKWREEINISSDALN